ncbi:reverse transcriptase [Ostertagia ostertagi]
MECHYSNNDKATASGGADAPIPRSQGIGGKTLTGQKKEIPRLLTPKSKLRLGSWNVRTAFHCGQKEIIARELSKCRVTVAALSELRISGCGTTRVQVPATDDWMTLYYSGGQEHRDGVGFMLNSHASKCVVSFQPISPRIAVITLGGTVKSHILQDVLDSIPRRDLVIVTGDLNARTGADRTGWEPVMGRFGVGEMNNNGLRLLSFATFNDLVIGNSLYQHARKHQLTWRNPSGHDSAVLDYVLINSRYRSSLKDVRAMRGPDCGSDHYLLRAVVQLRLQCAKRGKRQPKVDWEQLLKLEVKQGFQIALSNQFAAFTEVGTVDEEERQTAKVITECATQLCPVLRRRTKPWISDETLQLVDKRRKVKLTNGTTYQLLKPVPIEMPQEPTHEAAPSMEEVRAAVMSLKNRKAAGVDNVTAEAIKAGGEVLVQRLHRLMCRVWQTEVVPTTWKRSIIVPIHKKGDITECKNYRGISLLSVVGKVFTKIINARLQLHRRSLCRPEQAGFCPGHWPALWKALECEHVPDKIVRLLREAYNGTVSCIRVKDDVSEEFPVSAGVRQGDVISPTLFNVVMDAVMRKTFNGRQGVQYGEGGFLTDLMFADDSAIFAETDEEATNIMCSLSEIAQSYGLKINAEKTKVMTSDGSPASVRLGSVALEQTWTLLKSDLSHLEVFQMRCLRHMLGIRLRDHVTNNAIREKFEDQPTIEEQLKLRRLRWFGHLCRMGHDRIPNMLLWRRRPAQWKVQRTAPKKTWLKQVEEDLRALRCSVEHARCIAANRPEWRHFIQGVRTPMAPTAVYWLRGRPPPPDAS